MAKYQTCRSCRALLKPGTRKCPYCGVDQRFSRAPSEEQDAEATSRLGTWILTINIFLFALMLVLDPAKEDREPGFMRLSMQVLDMFGANDLKLIQHCGQYWRFLTACFLHLDLPHLLMNSIVLWILMPLASTTFGMHRTTCIYFGAGLAGSWLSHSVGHSGAGASGALCGLISALAVYGWQRGGIEGRLLSRRMFTWGLILIVYGLLASRVDRVDNAAHVGGFAGGAALGWLGSGLRIRGGGVDRLWLWGARGCLLLALVVAGVWMAPSIVRGFQRRSIETYQSRANRTLGMLEGVVGGEEAKLPESFPDGPSGTGEVRDAIREALAAVRDGAPDAAATVRAARAAWRRWERGLLCRYGVEAMYP